MGQVTNLWVVSWALGFAGAVAAAAAAAGTPAVDVPVLRSAAARRGPAAALGGGGRPVAGSRPGGGKGSKIRPTAS